MLEEELKSAVSRWRAKGLAERYIVSLIKEYVQNIVLDIIYSDRTLNKVLIFTGGTCLRFCYDLPRLSEDLDFDTDNIVNKPGLIKKIESHFRNDLGYKNISHSIKGKTGTIYLKFPLLGELALKYENSKILLIKLDIDQFLQENIKPIVSPINKYGRYFFLRHYCLEDLMSGKIHAFLIRLFFKGKENEIAFKGRDMFDLVWFMGKGVTPNMKRLELMFKGTKYEGMTWPSLLEEINNKALAVKKSHVSSDLMNFIEKPEMLKAFLDNYLEVIGRYCSA